MKIFYSAGQLKHAPEFGLNAAGRIPILEVPERVETILDTLHRRNLGEILAPEEIRDSALRRVHTADYLEYLQTAYRKWCRAGGPETGVLPDVFPTRLPARRGRCPANQAGWFCFDISTPIAEDTYLAACSSAAAALSGARCLLGGERRAYALCRPPGHHAGPDFHGGYCYLNNAAIAARELLGGTDRPERVAILDIDAHHGNGTQAIFYDSREVLFASLHADPDEDYPYYWGHADETGSGEGAGFNLNIPLPRGTGEAAYLQALQEALERIARFAPRYLVVSFGADTVDGDPAGGFALSVETFTQLGQRTGGLDLPTLVVQEGGYKPDAMGACVANFLSGLRQGAG